MNYRVTITPLNEGLMKVARFMTKAQNGDTFELVFPTIMETGPERASIENIRSQVAHQAADLGLDVTVSLAFQDGPTPIPPNAI